MAGLGGTRIAYKIVGGVDFKGLPQGAKDPGTVILEAEFVL